MSRHCTRQGCANSTRLTSSSHLFIFAAAWGVALCVHTHSSRAAVINLTTTGSSGTINGAIYEQAGPQSTGTGTIDTYSQQSPTGGQATSSQAYNTTVNNVLDNKSTDQHNHAITLGAVPVVFRSGTPYREFMLDTNENTGGGNEFLSLDEVQIFVGGTANSNVSTFTSNILDHDGTLVYRMDAGSDSWVALDYSLNSGSGSGDMFLLVPNSLFTSFAGTADVTLYSKFGLQGVNPSGFTGDFTSSDGFEEWALREGEGVPEPASMGLLLVGLAAAVVCRRRA